MDKALADLMVLDLSRVLAGPYGTMVLGDFGAEVIKVEQPDRGDDTRHWGPPFSAHGQSAYFLSVNRNKRSITLNLKSEEGRAILRDLAAQADVLIENFKVGGMERLGLGYERLRADNPGLIYCSITGYGQTGPYKDRPGYDTVIQAQSGLMSITGPTENGEDGDPFKVGVAIVDVTAGLFAVIGILSALHHRQTTGQGQHIDIALFDAQLGWLANVASNYLVSGQPPKRYANAHATIVPYQTFPTADGHLMLAVGNDGQFRALCRAMGMTALTDDPRFVTNPDRVANRAQLVPLLEETFRQRTTRRWIEGLLDADVPCGPVDDIPTALANPQAQAREMVQQVVDSSGDRISLVGPVIKMSETPPQIYSAPPRLGEQTAAVLREKLGFDGEKIEALRRAAVI
ncbi:MAG: CoA transferase [Caldilineaceae bacterium]|nr:CoA transferase [Caldilineaceae bacterium]